MRKFSLFTLLLALCFGYIQAQTYNLTLSGQVTDISNGAPIANYPVDVAIDSNFFGFTYYNTVTTDANGNYSDVIAVPGTVSQATGYTGLRDCTPAGYPMNFFAFSSGNPNVSNLDFAICTTPTGSCYASFQGQPVLGTTMVNFTDYSSGNGDPIVSWSWTFGDGGTSTQQNPSHAYNAVGPYTVCLSIATQSGCTSTYCDSLVVGGGSGSNCTASLQGSVSPTGVGTFTTTASGTGTPVSYFYDFGDGNTASGGNSVSHTYLVNGTYTACVYVMFSDSCTATSCTSVTVTGGLGCQAGYFWYPDSSGQYSIIVVNTSAGTNLTYSWTFGDGGTSTQAYPSHQYAGPGTYNVCVTITSNTGCSDTYCDSITVINKVSAPFSINVVASGATAVTPAVTEGPEVSLFPNPARDFVTVELNLAQDGDVRVSLLDLSGREVLVENAGEMAAGKQTLRLTTSDLPAGLYMARIQAGNGQSVRKVMIAH